MRTNKQKGDYLEKIVHEMYRLDGAKIETNVLLEPIRAGAKTRKREIDILITQKVAGIDVRIAIECKHLKKKVGAEQMGAFIDKLEDIGVPTQSSIFISASGFTTTAKRRAKEKGIKPLKFKERFSANLEESYCQALQSVLYLLPVVSNVELINTSPKSYDVFFFYDDTSKLVGTIPDIVHLNWINGKIPKDVGEHTVELDVPKGWKQIVNEKDTEIIKVTSKVIVYGLVLMLPGKSSEYVLVDPDTDKHERTHASLDFSDVERMKLEIFKSESEYEQRMESMKYNVKIGRFAIPKIKYHNILWPPSVRALEKFLKLAASLEDIAEPPKDLFTFESIEGDLLDAIWAPIYSDYIKLFQDGRERGEL